MDEQSDVAVDTSTDNTEVVEDTSTEPIAEALVKLAEAEEAKRQLTARAHKAETELKALKNAPKAENITNNGLSADDVDVKILQSQGVDEDSINYLKKLAKVNGTSILAAQTDELYGAYKSKKESDEKNAKATLGASRGSGQAKKVKEISTPGISTSDHRELWNKANGR